MKLIHVSDLHIGKRVNEISMIEEQSYILREMLRITEEEKPDAVLIAGDVYDKSVPSAEAVMLFDDFLYQLSSKQIPVLIISGNHDSSERLAFGNRMLQGSRIYVSPVYDGTIQKVTLCDEAGEVDFWLLPFLKPSQVRRFYPEETIESYTDACRVAIEKSGIDSSRRNVLLCHQFVTGAAAAGSEELSVGGSDNVDASIFEGFSYVALGHIHGAQNITGSRIRYSGSPLKYSLSEVGHHKSVTVVELDAEGCVTLHTPPLIPQKDLRRIRGSFAELTDPKSYLGTKTDDYLHIVLTDEEDVPEAVGRLRMIYPNIMKIEYDNTRTRQEQEVTSAQDPESQSPLELFEALYEMQNNQPMSEVQKAYMEELLRLAGEERT